VIEKIILNCKIFGIAASSAFEYLRNCVVRHVVAGIWEQEVFAPILTSKSKSKFLNRIISERVDLSNTSPGS